MIKFDRKELTENYNKCKLAIKKTNALPVFSNIRIIVSGNCYELIGVNSVYQITAKGLCESGSDLDVCIDSSKLGLMISSANDDIVLSLKDSVVLATSGKSKFKFAYLSGEDMPIVQNAYDAKIDFDLSSLLAGIYLNAPSGNVNPILNGVALDIKKGKVSAYATDGFSMAFSESGINFDEEITAIIPSEVSAIIANNQCNYFSIGKRNLAIEFNDDSILISKLIDGKLPNYKNVIPPDNDMYFSVNRKDLISIVATALKADERAMQMSISNGVLNAVIGDKEFTFESEITADSNGDLSESFSVVMMHMLCKIITSENLKIKYTNENQKKFLCSDGDKTYLMMAYKR